MRPAIAGGFTAIELLAATALAGMLMLAVLTVTGSLGRAEQVIENRSSDPSWRRQVTDLLRRDVVQARKVDVQEGVLIIEGWCRLDEARGTISHRPVTIRYRWSQRDRELDRRAEPGWLVREQTELLEVLDGRPTRAAVVCGEVSGFAAELVMPAGDDAEGANASTPTRDERPEDPEPIAVRVVIAFAEEQGDVIDLMLPLE